MSKQTKEGVEVARSPSAGGLSISCSKREIETLATFEDAGQNEMGQEATLVEIEVSPPKSTLGSVFFKLRPKKSKKKQTNIILPPQINQALAAQDNERRQEANQKADYARRLFDAAFRPDDQGRNERDPAEFNGMKEDDMIHTAFKYAVEARRLGSCTQVNKVAMEERENALEEHRAQGETSALEARRFINAIKSRALLANVDVGDEDDGSINGGLFTPQDIQDAAEKNIDVARSHLEYILSTFEKKIKAPEHIILNASPEKGAEDRTLSTLGFDNTFAQEASTFRKEMYSITSLNKILDETQSNKSALVGERTDDPQTVSPLSGTVYSDADFVKRRLRRKAKEGQDKAKIKQGTILLPPSDKNQVKKRSVMRHVVADKDDEDDVSEISGDLESIRQLESVIDRKLKKAAVEDDGEFSLVGEDAVILPPCMVSVPSFDPSIMSLENWDNLFEGGSLDDVIARSLRPRELTKTEVPKEMETNTKVKKKGYMIAPWKRRKDHSASKKEGTKKQNEWPTMFVPTESGEPPSNDVNIRDDPVDVLSLADTLEPCYDLNPIKFIQISSEARDSDEKEGTGAGASVVDESIVQKRRMMSWRRRSSTKGRGVIKQTESAEGDDGKLVTDVPKGVTTSTDDIVAQSSSEDHRDKFKITTEVNDVVQKNVRKVLSADCGNADGEVANKVDFAQVEIGEDNAVRTEMALVSRDAVVRHIYTKRTPIVSPHLMERSITVNGAPDQNVEPSSSFLDMIEKDKMQAVSRRKEEEKARDEEKRRFTGLFGRTKRKSQAPQTVYLQPPNFEQGA